MNYFHFSNEEFFCNIFWSKYLTCYKVIECILRNEADKRTQFLTALYLILV